MRKQRQVPVPAAVVAQDQPDRDAQLAGIEAVDRRLAAGLAIHPDLAKGEAVGGMGQHAAAPGHGMMPQHDRQVDIALQPADHVHRLGLAEDQIGGRMQVLRQDIAQAPTPMAREAST